MAFSSSATINLQSPTFLVPVVVLAVFVLVLLALAITYGLQAHSCMSAAPGVSLTLQGPVLAGATAATVRVQDTNPSTAAFAVNLTTGSAGSTGSYGTALPQAAQVLNGVASGTLQLTNLTPDTRYAATVTSVTKDGKPTGAHPLVVMFTTAAAGTPNPPTGLTLTRVPNTASDPPNTAAYQVAWTGAPEGVQYLLSFTTPFFTSSGVSAYGIVVPGPGPSFSVGIYLPLANPVPMPVVVSVTPIAAATNVAGPPFVTASFTPQP
jgi:hypothetical protein